MGSISVSLPTTKSGTWLVHMQVREPHLNPLVCMSFLPVKLVLKRNAPKVHTNGWVSDVVRKLACEPVRDGETTIKKRIAWGQRGKPVQNGVFFCGKCHDNKVLKVQICLSRILLSLRRLLTSRVSDWIVGRGTDNLELHDWEH